MKKAIAILLVALMLFAGVGAIAMPASAQNHPNPKALSKVPFEGFPWYLEDLVTGGIVSDYGSHYGLKACVGIKPAYDADKNFAKTTHYSALTSYTNGMIDRSWVSLKTADKELFAPADNRSIHFDYWGWSEIAKSGDIVAYVQTLTLDTDTFLVYLNFTNTGGTELKASPVIKFTLNAGEVKNENMMLGMVPCSTISYCTTDYVTNTVSITNADQLLIQLPSVGNPLSTLNLLTNLSVVRVIAPEFEIERVTSLGLIQSYTHRITGKPVSIPPGGAYETYYVIGVDQSTLGETDVLLASAKKKATAGRESVGNDPKGAINRTVKDWIGFFDGLPLPHTNNPSYKDLYYMAASALRMGLYAPRNAMEYYCSVPCKPHFNFFWCWDTPFHTVGQAEFGSIFGMDGTGMAEQNMYTQFTGQNPATGMIYIVVDDAFTTITAIYSQPPVHGWTISKVYEHEIYNNPQRAKEFIQKMYDASSKYMNFWSTQRDTNFDGLFEYNSAMETGWDDTPRYAIVNPAGTNIGGFAPMTGVDAIDLNSWLYIYMCSLSDWAGRLGDSQSSADWKAKADNLAALVENKMWSESDGCWYDINHNANPPEFVKVATPAMWFPAFAELSRNEMRIRSVIERHLLNPQEFFGQYPIPTVAYNSEYYNNESDGYYWRGQIWLITAYTALETLYKYGYEDEAEILKTRLLDMMADKGGIYETYDAKTGEVGWGCGGVGDPTAFQFGWSSTITTQMILDRYQRTRYIMSNDTEFSGYIKTAPVFGTDDVFYTVETGEYEVPHVVLKAIDGKTLRESKKITADFSDKYGNMKNKEFNVTIFGLNFTAHIGKVYEINLKDESVREVVREVAPAPKRRFISGFEIIGLLAASGLAMILLRKRW